MKQSRRLRKLVAMLACLALLPTDHILEGLDVIISVTERWDKVEDMVPLIEYWQRTWPRKLDYLSVSGCQDRTTNISESDNRMLQDDVKAKHPNVWLFLGELRCTNTETHEINLCCVNLSYCHFRWNHWERGRGKLCMQSSWPRPRTKSQTQAVSHSCRCQDTQPHPAAPQQGSVSRTLPARCKCKGSGRSARWIGIQAKGPHTVEQTCHIYQDESK